MGSNTNGDPMKLRRVQSSSDYSHKSQELNIFYGRDDVVGNEDLHNENLASPSDELINLYQLNLKLQPPPSKINEHEETHSPKEGSLEKLQQYDAERKYFVILYMTTVAIALAILVLVLVSTSSLAGGDSLVSGIVNDNNCSLTRIEDANFYTIHVICMILSMTIFSSYNILLYRLLPETPMWILKWIHGLISLIIIGVFWFGFVELIISSTKDSKLSQFNTIHSWTGLLIGVLFIFEIGSGVIFLISSKENEVSNSNLQKFHKSIGLIIQFVSCLAVSTGVTEFNNPAYMTCDPATSNNCFTKIFLQKLYGFLSIISFVLIFILMMSDRFKRKARPIWKCIYNNPHSIEDPEKLSKTTVISTSKLSLIEL